MKITLYLTFLLLTYMHVGTTAPADSETTSDPLSEDYDVQTEAYDSAIEPEIPNYDGLRVCRPNCPFGAVEGYFLCKDIKCNHDRCCYDLCSQKAVCTERVKRGITLWEKFLILASAEDTQYDEETDIVTTETPLLNESHPLVKRDTDQEEIQPASLSLSRIASFGNNPTREEGAPQSSGNIKEDITVSVDDETISSSVDRQASKVESQSSSDGNTESHSFRKGFTRSSVKHSSTIQKRDVHEVFAVIFGEVQGFVSPSNTTDEYTTDSPDDMENDTSNLRNKRQVSVVNVTSAPDFFNNDMPDPNVVSESSDQPFYDQVIAGYAHYPQKKENAPLPLAVSRTNRANNVSVPIISRPNVTYPIVPPPYLSRTRRAAEELDAVETSTDVITTEPVYQEYSDITTSSSNIEEEDVEYDPIEPLHPVVYGEARVIRISAYEPPELILP